MVLRFLVSLREEWTRDRIGDVAGSVTFFALLAVFPFLVFLVSLASFTIGPGNAEHLVGRISQVMPAEAASLLGARIRSLAHSNATSLLTVGALGAVWAASGGVMSLIGALNTVYGVPEQRPFWKVRLLAIATTLGGALMSLIATLVAVGARSLASALFGDTTGAVVGLLRFPVAGLLMTFVWACLYYFLPDVKQEFKFITPGSVVGVVLWLLGSYAFSVYVRQFGHYDATYGALGGVIVLLLWMWLSSQAVLLGAEINAILEHLSDGRVTKTELEREEGAEAGKALAPRRRPRRRVLAVLVWILSMGLWVLVLRRSRRRLIPA